jgi:hypothetical protein
VETLVKIAQAGGVTVDWLLTGADGHPAPPAAGERLCRPCWRRGREGSRRKTRRAESDGLPA